MKVGISLNNIVRDYFGQLEHVYDKYFPTEDGEGITVKDYDLNKWITFPKEESTQGLLEFNPEFNEDSFMETDQVVQTVKEEKEVTLDEFLYERCTLEIFGYAPELNGSMNIINNIILDNPDVDIIIMSREIGLSIPSTYFFLSKTSCMCQNIQFVKDNRNHWDYVDIMVTDDPSVLNTKPTNKKSIKVSKPYNSEIETDYTVNTIHELPELLSSL